MHLGHQWRETVSRDQKTGHFYTAVASVNNTSGDLLISRLTLMIQSTMEVPTAGHFSWPILSPLGTGTGSLPRPFARNQRQQFEGNRCACGFSSYWQYQSVCQYHMNLIGVPTKGRFHRILAQIDSEQSGSPVIHGASRFPMSSSSLIAPNTTDR